MRQNYAKPGLIVAAMWFLCAVSAHAVQGPDLTMGYTDGLTHAAPGGTLVYTLTITNNSNVDATNATATATVPPVMTFTSSPDGGVLANNTVTFSNLTIPANGSLNVQFNTALIYPLPAGTPHSYSSTATVTGDPAQGADPNPNDNSATDTDTLDLAPDPVICALTDGVACTYANAMLTYVTEVCDIGNIGITGVVVTNTIPAGTTFVSADNGGTFANGTVTWPAISIPVGVHMFRSVTVQVNSPLPAGVNSLVDSATITDDGTNGPDANPANNFITDTDCITPSADLAITKVVDINNPNIADSITYTVVVTNNGPDDASNVTASDLLPAGLTLVAVTQTTGNYDTGTGTWTIGVLANGNSATLTITATVNSAPPGQIVNTACVSNTPEIDPDQSNNCATVTITPSCAKKPTIVSGPTALPAVAVAGVPETFSLTASDNGSGMPVVVTWDFGDGTAGTGASVQHTYVTSGNYTVKATVANACGGVGTNVALNLAVASTPQPFQCSMLHAGINLAKANADSFTLIAELNLPAGFSVAGKRVLVQVNNLDYNAVLDASGRFSNATSSISIKTLGAGQILTLKIAHSPLRSLLLPGLPATTKSVAYKGMPFLIEIGGQSYGNAVDTIYTAKNFSGVLKK